MTAPIIKTEELSMDAKKALLKTLQERIAMETCQIAHWQKKASTTNESLSELGMRDLEDKLKAVKHQYTRLYNHIHAKPEIGKVDAIKIKEAKKKASEAFSVLNKAEKDLEKEIEVIKLKHSVKIKKAEHDHYIARSKWLEMRVTKEGE